MPVDPIPPQVSPSAQPAAPSVDALTQTLSQKTTSPARSGVSPEQMLKAKRQLLTFGGVFYAIYVLWCASLIMLLPSPDGGMQQVISIGILSAFVGGVTFILFAALAMRRIARADVSVLQRKKGMAKLVAAVLPGLLLSGLVPILITREPPLSIAITYPTRQEDLVAPVAVTFSVEKSVEILRARGLRAVKYAWDFEGDGNVNEETALPVATVLYDRQNVYTPAVRITLEGGGTRRIMRRVTIPRAVFSVSPSRPLIEKPVRFSIAHLVKDPKEIREIQWDFDGDGTPEETTKAVDILHTFYSVGRITVSALVTLSNQTQTKYERIVELEEPPPLPFDIRVITEPSNLVGPAPFGTIFRLETSEPLKEVEWSFGDDKVERGANLIRVGHSYEKPGYYSAVLRARSASGELAEITNLVRVTEKLDLPDLAFNGEPEVDDETVRGEVPLTVKLIPRTTVPLIEFSWEAPDATVVQSTGAELHAIYRREGTYTIRLLAQDPEGRALRIPITVEAEPPSAEPAFRMQPSAGGVAPLKVVFDASDTFVPTGERIAGFAWLFGDEPKNAPPELGAAHIEHTYEQPGNYTVTLKVVMESGTEFTATRSVVVRRPQISACLTVSRTKVQAGKGVEFDSSCTTGITTGILWDIRRSSEIVAESPEPQYVHVFEEPGEYKVTLTVTDQWSGRDQDSVTITVSP